MADEPGSVSAPRISSDEPANVSPRRVPVDESASVSALRVPDGWALEPLPYSNDQALLQTPPPSCMATIDFRQRGFRLGLVQSGRFVGEKRGKRGLERKAYEGRGWKQALLDDAIAHLREIVEAP